MENSMEDEARCLTRLQAVLEPVLSDAVEKAVLERTDDPLTHCASHLIEAAISSGDLAQVRRTLASLQEGLKLAHEKLAELVPMEPPTSRAGHLHTLDDLIGERPTDRTWKDEWVPMKMESNRRQGKAHMADEAYVREHESLDSTVHSLQSAIGRATAVGWPTERAEILRVLSNPAVNAILARALAHRDDSYAASTHALFNAIHAQRLSQLSEHKALPTRLYWNRSGYDSLADRDPTWALHQVEAGDSTGFHGLSCPSLVTATCGASNAFDERGFIQRRRGKDGEYVYETQDSDVVCIETAVDDEFGCHSPVMTSATSGVFPPNCLFRLKEVLQPGAWDCPVAGLRPMQRLLVFAATYRPPVAISEGAEGVGAKLCGTSVSLSYADRKAFVGGLDDILARPVLTMELEFDREMSWTDWHDVRYCARAEYAYVCGPAVEKAECTPGTRDANNSGKTREDFLEEVNAFIKGRREGGHGLFLAEQYAFLTLNEVTALRLYSGPAYQPINAFLRNVTKVTGAYREQLSRHASLTFAATCRHIIDGIRKLSAVATSEETSSHLWRGVRGELPRAFWVPDEIGTVVATETAFMSTSASRETRELQPGESNSRPLPHRGSARTGHHAHGAVRACGTAPCTASPGPQLPERLKARAAF